MMAPTSTAVLEHLESLIFYFEEYKIMQISCSKISFSPFYILKRQFPEEILYSNYLGINRTCVYASSNHIVSVTKKGHLTLGSIQGSLRSCPRRYQETAYINRVSSAWNTRPPSGTRSSPQIPLKNVNNNDSNDFIGTSIIFHVFFYVALFSTGFELRPGVYPRLFYGIKYPTCLPFAK